MKKAVAAVVAALAIAVSAVAAIASDNKPDRDPVVVDGVVVVTSIPRGKAPEIPGKPNRKLVPEPTGQDMTHTTNTVVRFR